MADQVSRPVQILLAVTVVFAALWFVALRPKSGGGGSSAATPAAATPPATPPATTTSPGSSLPGGLGNAVKKANTTKAAGDAAAAAADANPSATAPTSPAEATSPARATGGTNTASVPTPAKPAAVRRDLVQDTRVPRALDKGRAVVLLFSNAAASDDRAVAREVAGVNRHGGRVVVVRAPVSQVSRYSIVTADIGILQSPTVVVVGPDRRARTFVGFTDRTEIDQAVGAILRAADRAKKHKRG
jgi:hypothetical protein